MKYKKQSLSLVLIGVLSLTQNLFSYENSDSYLMYKFGSFFTVANNGNYIAVNKSDISEVQVEDLESNITLPTGATFKIYNKDTSEKNSGNLVDGDYLVVTSQDTTSTTTYKLYGIKPKIIASANRSSLLLTNSGKIYVTGRSMSGELGIGDYGYTGQYLQRLKIDIDNITDISIGSGFSLLLDKDGKVYSMGSGEFGKLGHGDIDSNGNLKNYLVPTQIISAGENNITAISAGFRHSLLLDKDGRVYSFGEYIHGYSISPLGFGTNKSDYERCDFYDVEEDQTSEYYCIKKPKQIMVAGENNITAIFAGYDTSFLLDKDGRVYSFGKDILIGLGSTGFDKEYDNAGVPNYIKETGENNITAIVTSDGSMHTFLIDKKRRVYAFGNNDRGELGIGIGSTYEQNKPIQVLAVGENNITTISAGLKGSLIIDKNAKAYSFGQGYYGQLGYTPSKEINAIPLYEDTPKEINVSNIVDISTSGEHSIIMDSNGNYYSFGFNEDFQLGFCHTNNITTPTKINFDRICVAVTPNMWQMFSTPQEIEVDTSTLTSQLESGSSVWAYRDGSFIENPTVNAKEGVWIKPNSDIMEFAVTSRDTTYDYTDKTAQFNEWKCNLNANKWNFEGLQYSVNWSDLTKSAITPDSGCEYSIVFNYDHDSDSWNSTDSLSKNSALYLKHICSSTPSCDNNLGR